jgi:hypothetical protein
MYQKPICWSQILSSHFDLPRSLRWTQRQWPSLGLGMLVPYTPATTGLLSYHWDTSGKLHLFNSLMCQYLVLRSHKYLHTTAKILRYCSSYSKKQCDDTKQPGVIHRPWDRRDTHFPPPSPLTLSSWYQILWRYTSTMRQPKYSLPASSISQSTELIRQAQNQRDIYS